MIFISTEWLINNSLYWDRTPGDSITSLSCCYCLWGSSAPLEVSKGLPVSSSMHRVSVRVSTSQKKREISEVSIQVRGRNASRMCWLSICIMVPTHSLVQRTFRPWSLGQMSVWVALSTDHWQCTFSKPYQNMEKSQGKTTGSKRNKELASVKESNCKIKKCAPCKFLTLASEIMAVPRVMISSSMATLVKSLHWCVNMSFYNYPNFILESKVPHYALIRLLIPQHSLLFPA